MQKIIFFVFLIFIFNSCYSQDLTQIQIKKYSDLGKVWGVMKYYHPNLANGNLNWNDSLRNYISQVKSCKSDKDFNSLLLAIYKSLGGFPTSQKFQKSKKYHSPTFEVGWISKSQLLDSTTKKNLENLISFYLPRKNTLISKESSMYDTRVIHNNEKDNLTTLIIAWNIIKYEAPHLKLGEVNWDDALEQYIPLTAPIDNPYLFEYVLAELISKIRDSHNYMTLPNYESYLGNNYLPFNIAFIENTNVVKQLDTAVLKNYNINIGDAVEAINDMEVNSLRDAFRKISRGGHLKVIDNEVSEFYMSRIKSNDSIKISLRKPDNELVTFFVKPAIKQKIYNPTKVRNKAYSLSDTVSYINLMHSSAKDIKNALNKFHNNKCIIIDNRGYPSGKTYSALFNRLAGGNDRIVNYYKQNNRTFAGTFPEKFLNNPYYHLRGYFSLLKPFYKKYKGKIIVLFDESTLSHAEFKNQGFDFIKNKVITVGRNTAGADGAVYFRYLLGKIRIAFTGDIVTYPDGTSTQKTGIVPDYYVEDSIDSLRKGEDDILNKAIEIATNGI